MNSCGREALAEDQFWDRGSSPVGAIGISPAAAAHGASVTVTTGVAMQTPDERWSVAPYRRPRTRSWFYHLVGVPVRPPIS